MAKQNISARAVNGWINDMDVTKSWIETEMDGQRGPDDYPSVIKIRCKVCSEFRARLKNMRNFSTAFIDGISGASLKRDNVKRCCADFHHASSCYEDARTANIQCGY